MFYITVPVIEALVSIYSSSSSTTLFFL